MRQGKDLLALVLILFRIHKCSYLLEMPLKKHVQLLLVKLEALMQTLSCSLLLFSIIRQLYFFPEKLDDTMLHVRETASRQIIIGIQSLLNEP